MNGTPEAGKNLGNGPIIGYRKREKLQSGSMAHTILLLFVSQQSAKDFSTGTLRDRVHELNTPFYVLV